MTKNLRAKRPIRLSTKRTRFGNFNIATANVVKKVLRVFKPFVDATEKAAWTIRNLSILVIWTLPSLMIDHAYGSLDWHPALKIPLSIWSIGLYLVVSYVAMVLYNEWWRNFDWRAEKVVN